MRINPNDLDLINDEYLYRRIKEYIASIAFDANELVYSLDRSISLPSLSSTYTNLFSDMSGRPFLIDTTGYTHGVMQIYWNKNAGVGTHSLRIVKNNDDAQILYENANLITGENLDLNVVPPVPSQFNNFAGKLRIQVKSSNGTDSPTFDAIRIYLRR